jgi:hypothetical protein
MKLLFVIIMFLFNIRVFKKTNTKLGMVAHVCNYSSQEVKAGRSRV